MTVESALMFSNFMSAIAFLSTLGVLMWTIRMMDEKEKKYINAILSKDVREYSNAQVTQGKKLLADEEEDKPAFFPETELSDDEWFDKIGKFEKN